MDFLWGAATSGHQIDGNNIHSDWWAWEKQGYVEGGVTSGNATDHWHRFREDLDRAVELGLNSYRFSIEWARIEPEEGKWDQSAFEWYDTLVAECEKRNLVPMATLHHFTSPQWFAEKGGFTWQHSPDRFKGYVRQIAKRLGGRIPFWCTFNEANVLVVGQYLGCFMPPARYKPLLASTASRNMLAAHVKAYESLHKHGAARSGPWKHMPLMVGIAHNMIDFIPWRKGNLFERFMAAVVRRYYNRAWPDAVTGRRQHFGVSGLIPYPDQVWEARGRKTIDFLGINYYTKVYVCFGPQKETAAFVRSKRIPVGVIFQAEKDQISDLGWPIHPKGLGRMIRFARRYQVPIIITENGIADAKDELRGPYIKAHLEQLAKYIHGGDDIRGYFHWSLIDNFEWIKGFGPQFGLYHVNYDTFARDKRSSADYYRDVIKRHHSGPPNKELL